MRTTDRGTHDLRGISRPRPGSLDGAGPLCSAAELHLKAIFAVKLFVFGLGYSSLRLLDLYADRFERISGTVRQPEKRARLRQSSRHRGLDVHLFDGAAHDPEIAALAGEADVLLVSVPPGLTGDPVLAAYGDTLRTGLAHVVYLSTIGVYGDHTWRLDRRGGRRPRRTAERAKARLAAEAGWGDNRRQQRLAILRLAGSMGPERNALARLRDGSARRIVKPGQVFNRIHVDDIARAIMAAVAARGFRRLQCL